MSWLCQGIETKQKPVIAFFVVDNCDQLQPEF